MRIGQITLGAGRTQLSALNIRFAQLVIQNNASHSIRVGDNTVTSSTGILISPGTPGGSFGSTLSIARGQLSQYYIIGTQNDVIDFLYENI